MGMNIITTWLIFFRIFASGIMVERGKGGLTLEKDIIIKQEQ
jgi:hypothetical protein